MKQTKIWLAALCGITLLSACGSGAVKKEKKCDREEMGLVGKVKSLSTPTEMGDGEVLCIFNEAGNLLSETFIEDGPDIVEILLAEYTYGDDGKLTSISRYNKMDGSLDVKELYDANGNMTAREKYNTYRNGGKEESKVYNTTHYVYDENGLLTKSYINSDEKNASLFECDAAGNVLKQTDYFMGKESRILRFSYKYDSRGNITEECKYEPEIPGKENPSVGKVVEKKEYKYDKNDFMLQQVQSTYTHDGKTHYLKQERTFKYTPDEHHNQAEVTSTVCTYPEPRAENQDKHISDGHPVSMTYTYDDQGNWTSRQWAQGGRERYTARTITYFE